MNKLQLARDKWLHAKELEMEARVEYLGVVRLAERSLGWDPKRLEQEMARARNISGVKP